MLTIPKRGKQKEVETQTAQLKRAKSLDQQTEEPNSPVKAKHAAAANVIDWSSINVQLFNFHAAGASAHGPNASLTESSEPVGARASQILCKSWNKGCCVGPFACCHFAQGCSSCSGAHRAAQGQSQPRLQSSPAACSDPHPVPPATLGERELPFLILVFDVCC